MQFLSSPVPFLFAHVDGLRGAKQEVGPEVFSQLSSTLPWEFTSSMLLFSYPTSPGGCLKALLLQTLLKARRHWQLRVPPVAVSLL